MAFLHLDLNTLTDMKPWTETTKRAMRRKKCGVQSAAEPPEQSVVEPQWPENCCDFWTIGLPECKACMGELQSWETNQRGESPEKP